MARTMNVNIGKKLSILHTEASMGWGGQEIRILQEAVRFTKLGYRVLIACQEGSQIAKNAAISKLPLHIVRMRLPFDPPALVKFLQIIKSEKIDIIHTHSSKDSWIAGMAGRISGVPVVRSRHLSTPVGQKWMTALVYRYFCDAIIASGKHIKEALTKDNGIDPEKIYSIAAGVDIKRYNTAISRDKVRNELQLRGSLPVVGMVAILRSWKGHRYLLEAVPKIVSIYPDAKFLIVGNGPQWDNLNKKVHDLRIGENVIMTNFRDDIPEIIAALDILVLPSIASEATSQVIPQALAMGKPVIAANVGGLPEIIEDGVTGLLVPPKDHEAISNAVIWMTEHREKAHEMAMKGKDKILKNYTFQKMIEQTDDVYNQVLRKKRKQIK